MHLDFSALRVAVVGDLILDRYLEGAVSRISPEAPVPVLLHEMERDVLGGAANVAANLASLGAQVELVGLVGADDSGFRMTRMLASREGVRTAGIIVEPSRPTTCKTRIVSSLYQLVRIDVERTDKPADACESSLIEAAARATDWAQVIVLSDYAKGVCSDRVLRAVIDLARAADKPCIVDPKRKDFGIYRNATVIKPNRQELSEAARGAPCGTDEEVVAAARTVIAQTGAGILVTRSEQGMSYIGPDDDPIHMPTAAKNVFDVSGAGDTVIAVASIAMAADMAKVEMMRLANIAAGIVVGKVGTAIVTGAELDAAVSEEAHHPWFDKGALVSRTHAVSQRQAWRRAGLRVGFTNGCFDLLHPGHVSLLRFAAEACDRLIVAINTDASVKRLKGPSRPVQAEDARAYVLGGLSAVDLVVLFDEDTPAEAIAALEPDLLVKGADYKEENVVGADIVRANGGRVLLAPIIEGQSTSTIIERSRM